MYLWSHKWNWRDYTEQNISESESRVAEQQAALQTGDWFHSCIAWPLHTTWCHQKCLPSTAGSTREHCLVWPKQTKLERERQMRDNFPHLFELEEESKGINKSNWTDTYILATKLEVNLRNKKWHAKDTIDCAEEVLVLLVVGVVW